MLGTRSVVESPEFHLFQEANRWQAKYAPTRHCKAEKGLSGTFPDRRAHTTENRGVAGSNPALAT